MSRTGEIITRRGSHGTYYVVVTRDDGFPKMHGRFKSKVAARRRMRRALRR